MPIFGTVRIGEARANAVTGQRAALLQEYVGYVLGARSERPVGARRSVVFHA